jgi:hypothetical protein
VIGILYSWSLKLGLNSYYYNDPSKSLEKTGLLWCYFIERCYSKVMGSIEIGTTQNYGFGFWFRYLTFLPADSFITNVDGILSLARVSMNK